MTKLTKEDLKWRATSDAQTLIEADSIKSDKTRLKLAISEAKRLAKEAEVMAKAAKKIAKVSTKKKPMKRSKKSNKRK